jgi:hypothetical protein
MPEPRRDDPLERLRQLERENRVWKTLFFGLLSGLMGVLLVGWVLHGQGLMQEVEEKRRQVEKHQRWVEEPRHRLEQLLQEAGQEPESVKGRAP